jgi:UDP-glucose 4-epimerase
MFPTEPYRARDAMRAVITGATGNVGAALMGRLADDPAWDNLVGIARRIPQEAPSGVKWVPADITDAALEGLFAGADVVVHLAWEIQPSHDPQRLWRTNVLGSRRVFEAAEAVGVPALVHASSIGVYSEGPSESAVDEGWPRHGVPTCSYAVHKAECERLLDAVERRSPAMRVVRMRPALIFSKRAASSVGRLFLGPLVPRTVLRRAPVLPDIPGLRFQAVHSDDVADAYARAMRRDVRGAFNIAAEPVLDVRSVAELTGARLVRTPVPLARAGVGVSWRLRLQPTAASWLDMALGVPVMDSGRARRELGWSPRVDGREALAQMLEGLATGAAARTPALRPGRTRESPEQEPNLEEAR